VDRVWEAAADSSYREGMRAFLILLPALLLLSSCAGNSEPPPPEPIERVDLPRYMGKWYEIARLPNDFQEQCVGSTTAEYTLRTDGRIDVMNRCRTAEGEIDVVRGIARPAGDDGSNARLEVSFFDILGWRPAWDDYWIIGLERGYDWAVVGQPEREYGWILSRSPRLTDTTRERIDRLLREQGYDPEQFIDSSGNH